MERATALNLLINNNHNIPTQNKKISLTLGLLAAILLSGCNGHNSSLKNEIPDIDIPSIVVKNISISSSLESSESVYVGDTLSANVDASILDPQLYYSWKINGVVKGTEQSYQPENEDYLKYLELCVTVAAGSGSTCTSPFTVIIKYG